MKPVVDPTLLYKYREDSERTEGIFRTGQVWLASPNQLNDPFECKTGHIPEDWKAATIRRMEEGQLMGMARFPGVELPETLFSLNRRQTNRWWKKLRTLSHRDQVKAMRKLYSDHGIELSRPEKIFDDMQHRLDAVGIFSLSEFCDNELMWAHYGNSHHGLVIGFRRDAKCKLSDPRHTLPVVYTEGKPTYKAGFKNEVSIYAAPNGGTRSEIKVSFDDEVFRASLSTKTPAWSYEREWRYVEESHGPFDWPGSLATITFGLRMSSERRRFYRTLIQETVGGDVQYFEMAQRPSLSGLEIRPLAAAA